MLSLSSDRALWQPKPPLRGSGGPDGGNRRGNPQALWARGNPPPLCVVIGATLPEGKADDGKVRDGRSLHGGTRQKRSNVFAV
ncbi:hypothetical protein GCM10027294_20540 [Marinactinospora endophytica]